MKSSLERRILLFSFLALTLTIAVNTGLNVDNFRRSYRDGILKRAETFAVGLKEQIESVVNLGLPLAEIETISLRCQEIIRNDPEISYCLVEDSAGTILYHNQGLYPETAKVEFVASLTPKVSSFRFPGVDLFYDFAVPIYDFNDQVVGRVRIGFADSVLRDLVSNHLTSSVLVLVIGFAVLFGIFALFSRYDLVLPIRRLCKVAEEVAAGRFEVEVPEQRTRELALLGTTLKEMAGSLQERDRQLRENFQELEETNLELQKSYENLEVVSSDLGRSREMYRTLLDDASDAILVCNDEDNLIITNKAAERFFGLPRVQLEGRNYFAFLELINCHGAEPLFDHYLGVQPGQPVEDELRFWRALDQRSLLGRATSTAIVDKDGKRLVQVIVHDATREEEVRQSLERTAREIERLTMMKNSFLGLASHELKTPLTIIMGYVELLLSDDRETRLGEDDLDLVRHISRASERLSEIVRDMVDVSLLDGRTVELVSQEVDVNILVHRAVDKVQSYVEQRGQVLTLDLGNALAPVRCDIDRMIQALGNVLGNAIKFTPDRGAISVRTRLVERPRVPEKLTAIGDERFCSLSDTCIPYVEIAIADKGIGIAEAEQEAIFEKFHEVGQIEEHSTGKVAFKSRGAGLGLSIVKGIVDLHGGAVWVESPGHDMEKLPGSTFYILLPTVAPGDGAAEAEPEMSTEI